ncbi:hypothetical protein [Rhodopseudomonas palustris]|uniref:Uncharacterized protein n=1 Tax=Rhodopseudomonas palustris (strain ATCC BAA-98 / CGA009) TaxID=258594 RepID=Q6N4H6_RHOPA|nr:hypothetical protein [Rhodopseudomonas palustris]ACF02282.1 conserved hypothetical protein, putative membrane protein [Rhodopseudomonas palustris TIE-1]OPF96594.1 hypothetical protein B1S06_03255 [Rhodopseudomonas palustris]PPQ44145.1 hypothetical protein CKO39_07880 [Rhodopseudomonas palustris]QLH72381.1 hypothetical protein HZF03_16905 [Rhodopseudomonas palustris]QQM04897.1 hypothetical protein I8G32_03460 [Rhodopseudomonas palustris]
MAYLAIGLALAGFLIGLRFRLVGLLQALALVLLLTIGTCIGLGYGFTRTIVVVFAAQAAIQVGYFFGLLAQTLYQSRRTRMVL